MRSPGEQNYIREGRGGLKVFLSLPLGTVATPTPDSRSLLTLNEKKNIWSVWATASFDPRNCGTRWTNQTLLFQSMLRHVKRLKPFRTVEILPFLQFFKI